jgi:hypothetical protein
MRNPYAAPETRHTNMFWWLLLLVVAALVLVVVFAKDRTAGRHLASHAVTLESGRAPLR